METDKVTVESPVESSMCYINEDEARAYLYEHQSEARTYDSFQDFSNYSNNQQE